MEAKIQAIADAANISREGKLNILGAFNTIYAAQLPVSWPSLVFVVKLEMSAGDPDTFEFRFRVVDGEGNQVGAGLAGKMTAERNPAAPPGYPATIPFIFPVALPTFPDLGEYTFELWIDNARIAHSPMYVMSKP